MNNFWCITLMKLEIPLKTSFVRAQKKRESSYFGIFSNLQDINPASWRIIPPIYVFIGAGLSGVYFPLLEDGMFVVSKVSLFYGVFVIFFLSSHVAVFVHGCALSLVVKRIGFFLKHGKCSSIGLIDGAFTYFPWLLCDFSVLLVQDQFFGLLYLVLWSIILVYWW